jgi:4-amino-4-deoxy-L-arabinose transferase-like glycosyltransferase
MSKEKKPRISWVFFQNLLIGLGFLAIFSVLYIWRLGTLVPGKSDAEIKAIESSKYFGNISDDPLYLPHKLVQFAAQSLGQNGDFWMRLCSVIFAIALLAFFYWNARQWFGKLTAIIGTLILAATPLVVISGRSASAEILLLYPLVVIAVSTWLNKTNRFNSLAWVIFMAILAIAFYIPGLIWFLIISLAVNYKRLLEAFSKASKIALIVGFVLFIILIAPLLFVIGTHFSVLKELLLIPGSFPSVIDFFKNLVWSVLALTYKFPEHMPYILGKLPVLSVAQSVLALVGVYALWKKARKEIYSLVTLFCLGIFFTALNRDFLILLLCLPAVMIFAAAGLRFLFIKWMKIFPLNPIPRTLAIVLVFVLVVAHTAFGARYALIAWPQNLETRNTYMLK